MPLVGGGIGYITNRLAVAMIFRPVEPRRILGLRIHGLVPRRKSDLARSIGRVVGAHLVNHEDIVRAMGKLDVEALIERAIERGLEPKIAELRRIPLLGNFLTDERVGDIRRSLTRGLAADSDGLVEEFERAIEDGLDVQDIVTRKVEEFPVQKLEELILEVASKELRAIELLGGLLGTLIGLGQAALLAFV
jgi:uncharacterized membrane protein YheB (UPF0754 family)